MNSRHIFFAALLLSVAPKVALGNSDLDYKSDCALYRSNDYTCVMKDSQRSLVSQSDFLAGLTYLVAQGLPGKATCSFNPKGRVEKVVIKHLINNHVLKNSLDIPLVITPQGQINVITTDQFMEVAAIVLHDLYLHKKTSVVLSDVLHTYVREKIVGAALWLLQQGSVEGILPSEISSSTAYQETRNELARYYADELVDKIANS
jgi:hypothetical protein